MIHWTPSFSLPSSSCAGQILFSADDEMEDSDGDDDVRRLTGLKPVKKKKHRLGIPVWIQISLDLRPPSFSWAHFIYLNMDQYVRGMKTNSTYDLWGKEPMLRYTRGASRHH